LGINVGGKDAGVVSKGSDGGLRMCGNICSVDCIEDGAKDTTLGNRGPHREVVRVLGTLTHPEEPVPQVGLQDKVVGGWEYPLELEQQARVPDSIEGLGHVEKDTPAVLPPLKGGGNGVHNAKALLDCGMGRPKAKLVVWDGVLFC
jgi:hypothetical protein